jgi:hypothetical protein
VVVGHRVAIDVSLGQRRERVGRAPRHHPRPLDAELKGVQAQALHVLGVVVEPLPGVLRQPGFGGAAEVFEDLPVRMDVAAFALVRGRGDAPLEALGEVAAGLGAGGEQEEGRGQSEHGAHVAVELCWRSTRARAGVTLR